MAGSEREAIGCEFERGVRGLRRPAGENQQLALAANAIARGDVEPAMDGQLEKLLDRRAAGELEHVFEQQEVGRADARQGGVASGADADVGGEFDPVGAFESTDQLEGLQAGLGQRRGRPSSAALRVERRLPQWSTMLRGPRA